MVRYAFFWSIVLGFCLIGPWSRAENAYVTDSLKITFRSGPSTENKIISMLSSGQPVEVVESQEKWTHVRLLGNGDGDEEGWILSQYLMTRPPWETRFKTLLEENTQLKETLTPTEEKLNLAVRREKELVKNLEETTQGFHKLKEEYDTLKKEAAGFLKLKATYLDTVSKLETMQADFDALSVKYGKLSASERTQWFATGAGVLLVGAIIGLIVGKRQKKKRSSYY
jgi:SH3 domain protein